MLNFQIVWPMINSLQGLTIKILHPWKNIWSNYSLGTYLVSVLPVESDELYVLSLLQYGLNVHVYVRQPCNKIRSNLQIFVWSCAGYVPTLKIFTMVFKHLLMSPFSVSIIWLILLIICLPVPRRITNESSPAILLSFLILLVIMNSSWGLQSAGVWTTLVGTIFKL